MLMNLTKINALVSSQIHSIRVSVSCQYLFSGEPALLTPFYSVLESAWSLAMQFHSQQQIHISAEDLKRRLYLHNNVVIARLLLAVRHLYSHRLG